MHMCSLVLFEGTVLQYNEKCGGVGIKQSLKNFTFSQLHSATIIIVKQGRKRGYESNCQYHNCKTRKEKGE